MKSNKKMMRKYADTCFQLKALWYKRVLGPHREKK